MTLTTIINDIAIQTISKIISNLAWFILIYWGIKTIVKQMPNWIEQYDKIKMKHYSIGKALSK